MMRNQAPTPCSTITATRLPTAAGRWRHAWWMLYLPIYLLMFAYAERTVRTGYWVSYIPLDDAIPFVAPFVYFYVLWYPLQLGVGIWLVLRDAPAFRRYIWSIMIGFTGTIIFCLLFPNGQDLRPAVVPGSDLAAALVRTLYAADTNTNVLPSVHVYGSLLVIIAVLDSRSVRWPLRIAAVSLSILIILSTVFIKQHSALDLVAGIAAAALVYPIVYVGIRRAQDRRAAALPAGRPNRRTQA